MDVAAWLRGLGLEQYAPAFRDNDVDGEVPAERWDPRCVTTTLRATTGTYGFSAKTRARAARAAPASTTSLASLETWMVGAPKGFLNRSHRRAGDDRPDSGHAHQPLTTGSLARHRFM